MYKWSVVGMLWFVCLFNYADRQAIYSVFPLLKTEMGLTDVQLGIIGASFMWVYAMSAPLAGIIGDRFSRKTLIIGGLIFWSFITIATALSKMYWQLVLFRALEGLGEAFYFPASMSMLSDYHGRDTRSRAMSLHQSSVYAGTIAGGTIAGAMGQSFGWRSSFYLLGILGALLGLVLMLFLKEPVRGQAEVADAPVQGKFPPRGGSRQNAGTNRPMVLILMTVFVGANFVAAIVLTWMPSFLYRKFGMSLAAAGFSSTAYLQVASVLGVLRRRARGSSGAPPARRPHADAGDRAYRGSPIHLHDWVDRVDSCPYPRDGRLWILQGLLRRQHLGLAARRCPDRAAGHGGWRDERGGMGRRRHGADRDRPGISALRHERVDQRQLDHLSRRRATPRVRHSHIHA